MISIFTEKEITPSVKGLQKALVKIIKSGRCCRISPKSYTRRQRKSGIFRA